MAQRNRQVNLGVNYWLSNMESDLVAQALDNYRDTLPEKHPFREKLNVMVDLFDNGSANGEYKFD